MKKIIKAGATSQTIDLFIQDSASTTGGGKTGIAYNAASLTAYYRKGATGSATAITLATQTVGGAYSSGGFVEIDATNMPGMYRLDLPNAVVDTAGSVSLMLKGASGMAPLPIELQVIAADLDDATALGLSRLDAAITSRLASAGYTAPLVAAGTRTAVGLASANLDTQIGLLATASALATVATYIDTEVAAILAAVDTEVAAIKAKTDNLPAAPAATGDIPSAAAIRAEMDANSTKLDVAVSSRLASAGYTAPLDAAAMRTAVGLAAANLDTQIALLATASALATIAGYLDTEVAAIKAKTDSLTFTEAGKVDANLLSIGGDTTAAAAFKRAVLGNTVGTVGTASTTTSIVTSSLTPAASVADQFKGRIVTFAQDTTTAALRGQATDITASTGAGILTVTALTTAPVSGDTFAIT